MTILQESPVLRSIPLSIREEFRRRLDKTVKSSMMEDILFVQLSKDPRLTKDYEVRKYRDSLGLHEYDLVLTDRKRDQVILFEVKHSKEYTPIYQAQHLLDNKACTAVEQDLHATIDGKAIIYRGKTQPCTQGISYININDFLTEPMAFLNVIRNYYQGENWNSSLCQRIIATDFPK